MQYDTILLETAFDIISIYGYTKNEVRHFLVTHLKQISSTFNFNS